MTFEKYKELSPRTLPSLAMEVYELEHLTPRAMELGFASDLAHMGLGIHSETEELIVALKSGDLVNIGEELADKCWYISGLIYLLNKNSYNFDINYQFVDYNNISEDNRRYVFSITRNSSILSDKIKRILAYRTPIVENKTKKEIELVELKHYCLELLKSINYLASSHGINMEDHLDKNIRKLYTRYPDKFSTENATIRNLIKERNELEN